MTRTQNSKLLKALHQWKLQSVVARLQRSPKFRRWERILYKAAERHAEEPHYTPTELSKVWGVSRDTIRRLFEHEPGVLKLGDPNPKGKRRRVSLRIPHGVAERVHRKLSV